MIHTYEHDAVQAVRDDVVNDLLGQRETDTSMVIPMDVSGISSGSSYIGSLSMHM